MDTTHTHRIAAPNPFPLQTSNTPSKESLMIENAKNALFLKGTKTSQVVTDLLKNWVRYRKAPKARLPQVDARLAALPATHRVLALPAFVTTQPCPCLLARCSALRCRYPPYRVPIPALPCLLSRLHPSSPLRRVTCVLPSQLMSA